MRLITDVLPALIAQWTTSRFYRFTNQGYEDWFGIPRSEINGRPMREVLGRACLTAAGIMSSALEARSVFGAELPAPGAILSNLPKATFIPALRP